MIYSIYGFGKMKTESAIGCTIRALSNNEKVLFIQFLKDGRSSEIKFFKNFEDVKTLFGEINKITLPKNLTTVDKFKAQCLFVKMLNEIKKPNTYKLIVADELLPAIDMGLITIEQFEILVEKCNELEIDLYSTGRIRNKTIRVKVAELSDTCTDAHCVRHSFNTHCNSCDRDFPYHYTYCPDCGAELTESKVAKIGRDL